VGLPLSYFSATSLTFKPGDVLKARKKKKSSISDNKENIKKSKSRSKLLLLKKKLHMRRLYSEKQKKSINFDKLFDLINDKMGVYI